MVAMEICAVQFSTEGLPRLSDLTWFEAVHAL